MTPTDLNTLAHDIAEAAAKCVGAEAGTTTGRADEVPAWTREDPGAVGIIVTARAGAWLACGDIHGHPSAALNCAAVLALRDRVVAQREERARMLAADDAALRVIDETARLYDAETLDAAIVETCERLHCDVTRWRVKVAAGLPPVAPWTRAQVDRAAEGDAFTLACDAILRRRAGTP